MWLLTLFTLIQPLLCLIITTKTAQKPTPPYHEWIQWIQDCRIRYTISPVEVYHSIRTRQQHLQTSITSTVDTQVCEHLTQAILGGVDLKRLFEKCTEVKNNILDVEHKGSLLHSRWRIHSTLLLMTNLITKWILFAVSLSGLIPSYDLIVDGCLGIIGTCSMTLYQYFHTQHIPQAWAVGAEGMSPMYAAWVKFELQECFPPCNDSSQNKLYTTWQELLVRESLEGSICADEKNTLRDLWLRSCNQEIEQKMQHFQDMSPVYEFLAFVIYTFCCLFVPIYFFYSILGVNIDSI
ncbi:MAG: hypothetical protein OXT67_08095 [Zetaproteobacteria bacterium]|nr:hypothetical protein [Zetaproteobacteria bacterium]